MITWGQQLKPLSRAFWEAKGLSHTTVGALLSVPPETKRICLCVAKCKADDNSNVSPQ